MAIQMNLAIWSWVGFVYPLNSFEKEPDTMKDAWLWLTAWPLLRSLHFGSGGALIG